MCLRKISEPTKKPDLQQAHERQIAGYGLSQASSAILAAHCHRRLLWAFKQAGLGDRPWEGHTAAGEVTGGSRVEPPSEWPDQGRFLAVTEGGRLQTQTTECIPTPRVKVCRLFFDRLCTEEDDQRP